MLHETYSTGSLDMTMGLKYSGGLDMFPYNLEGTMLILVKTSPPKPDAGGDSAAAAPPTAAAAAPASPAAGGADAGVDKVVTVDTLKFESQILSADRPIIEDTAAGFAGMHFQLETLNSHGTS